MEIIQDYQRLPECLKEQIKRLQSNYDLPDKVNNYYSHLKEKTNKEVVEKHGRILMRLAILLAMTPFDLMEPDFFSILSCYNDKNGDKIVFRKLLKKGKHARVVEGKNSKNRIMIVKWYGSGKRDTCFEAGIYERLKEMGCSLPYFSADYYFWNRRVLVFEKLKKLNGSDDEFELAIQLIQQLKKLHTFGVHCDIKPQNVMKKINKDGTHKYLLIDYGGIAYEKLGNGYRRWLWSPDWTSQEAHVKDQVVTMKADFVELTYTMKWIQNARKKRKNDDTKRGYKGRLKSYFDFVNKIDEKNIDEDIHDQLIDHIKNSKETSVPSLSKDFQKMKVK